MNFTHQTTTEILTTRHVRVPDDLEEITISRECYLQILSMTLVAKQLQKENNGNENNTIEHLRNESSRMETRLIELCGETFEDIKNGPTEDMNELFDNTDYKGSNEDATMTVTEQNRQPPLTEKQTEGTKISYSSAVANSNKSIRMRMSFRGQQSKTGKTEKAVETKRLCKALLNGACHFDENAKITTWNEYGPEVGLRDITLLSEETTNRILDIPRAAPLKGDVHSIGIRIVTSLSPEQFSRNWNKYRWKSSHASLIRMREAETQSPNKAYAIGHIQGTSPNGDYSTMKAEIVATTGNKAEASWQMFNITNVSSRMWNVAKSEARSAVGNDKSPEFKRKKFALSPEGLTIYVKEYEDIKSIKKHLIDKYGRRTKFLDGSVARFIPYIHGRVKDRKEIDDKLFKLIKTHCMTKASEITIPIDIQDIHETKEYLGGKSIEQIIHNIKDDKGDVIFNHIGYRWNTEYNSKSYMVTASESKMEDAQKAVDNLKSTLHKLSQPPEKIFHHFSDAQKGLEDPDAVKRKRTEATQDDEDAQTYYAQEDDCGLEERKNLPPYVMHIFLDNKENDDASSMGFSMATRSTLHGGKRGILKRHNQGNSDDDDSMESTTTAFTNKTGATARSVKFNLPQTCDIIEGALLAKGITRERFRAWKEENIREFELILKLHSTTVHRVKGIRKVLKMWTGTAVAGEPSTNT